MNKKINVFINGKYEFSTHAYKTCTEAVKDIRTKKRILVASIPNKHIVISDNDTVKATYRR